MKKKIVYYLIGIILAWCICLALCYVYFYTGKIKKLECQITGTYYQNQRNLSISFQRNLPIKLEHWTIYRSDNINDEFNNLYQENKKINDFRNSQKRVTLSMMNKEENSFSLYTVVDLRWANIDEISKIDGFYKMIFSNGKKMKNVREYLEKNNYICTSN